jgi:hypothetical protein
MYGLINTQIADVSVPVILLVVGKGTGNADLHFPCIRKVPDLKPQADCRMQTGIPVPVKRWSLTGCIPALKM